MLIAFNDYLFGAGVATDLVNTSPVVRSAGDVLGSAAALKAFLAEHEVRPSATPGQGDLGEVHALRQKLRAILAATTAEQVADDANALMAEAGTGPVLLRDPHGRWQWYVTTSAQASLADELAVLTATGLLGALRTLGADRFRACASPTCAGVFVDTSKAGRRRYCMPDLCGNRVNVANHRARRRDGQDAQPT